MIKKFPLGPWTAFYWDGILKSAHLYLIYPLKVLIITLQVHISVLKY